MWTIIGGSLGLLLAFSTLFSEAYQNPKSDAAKATKAGLTIIMVMVVFAIITILCEKLAF